MRPLIYLAGGIAGQHYDQAEVWRNEFKQMVGPHIACLSPLRGVEHLRSVGVIGHGSYSDPLCTDRGILSRDHFDCRRADLVVCNLLHLDRHSLGSAMECAWAFTYRKPLILIMEDGGLHDHPMLRAAADFRVYSVSDAADLSLSILLP